ncbi:hypothetical protein E4T56_gene20154 [Termitomyces sp. T112]|nr:hypothetical protein E4T56_gene20154 [Termitomyces sp. T112]
MDSSEGASSEDAPELDSELSVAKATDNEGPALVGAALAAGTMADGSAVAAKAAFTTLAMQPFSHAERGVPSALLNLKEHAEALPVVSSGYILLIIPLYSRGNPDGSESTMVFNVDPHEQVPM